MENKKKMPTPAELMAKKAIADANAKKPMPIPGMKKTETSEKKIMPRGLKPPPGNKI